MRSSWIGSVAKLALGLVCAVALSTAPFGCSQNKGSVTQTKHSAGCPKDCKKSCCAKAAAGTCPHAGNKPCTCKKGEGRCHKDCKCAKKAAGTCPHAGKKPCSCKKSEGKCQHGAKKPCPGKKAEGE